MENARTKAGSGKHCRFHEAAQGFACLPRLAKHIHTQRPGYIYASYPGFCQNQSGTRRGHPLLVVNTIWNTGLNRYIDEVTVGHKEGDLTGVANDVGIIYANHPYLLAIMSTGQDDVELGFEYIGQISRIIYDYQVEQELAFGKEPSP